MEEDLTPEMMEGVTIHYARTIEDVLAVALPQFKAQPIVVVQPAANTAVQPATQPAVAAA